MRDSDEAVGLLNLSDAVADTGFLGDVSDDSACRVRARDAAVGAYKLDDREVGMTGVRDGVFGRAGVLGLDGADGLALVAGLLWAVVEVVN